MQKLKDKKLVLFFSVVAFIFSLALRQLVENNSCGKDWSTCVGIENLLPIFYILFIPAILSYLFKAEVYMSWLKLLAWYLPISVLLGLPQGSSWGPSMFPESRSMVWILSINLVVFSLVLFVIRNIEIIKISENKKFKPWLKWIVYVATFALSTLLSVYIFGILR